MKTVSLGEVCAITMGQSPPGHSYNDQGSGVALVAGAGDFADGGLTPTKFTTAPSKTCVAGDIVLGIRASIGAKRWADGVYCLGRGVAGLRAGPALDSRFLWHFLTSQERSLLAKGRGATFLQVNRKDLSEIPVSLPALEEQRRIAAILDRADALRARRSSIRRLYEMVPNALLARLTDATEEGFERARLGDIVRWSSGKFLPASAQHGGSHRVYGGNGVNGMHDEYIHEDSRLIVGRVGANCGAVHVTAPESWVTDNALVGTLLMEGLNLTYLEWALKAANLNQYAAVSGQPSISGGRIADVAVMLPPGHLQSAFAASVEAVRSQVHLHERADRMDDEMFAALHYRAFRGEL